MNKLTNKVINKMITIINFFEGGSNYYLLDNKLDILKWKNTDFSKYGEELSKGVDGKMYNIHDPNYWDLMWTHWGESKQFGKSYYGDIPVMCEKAGIRNILEIGCGPGYLVSRFVDNKYFNKYVTCDISKKSVEEANNKVKDDNRFDIKVGNIIDYVTKLEGYDIVIGVDVLEHLPDEVLNEVVCEINKSTIKFVFVTPYLHYVPAPEHIQCFSKLKYKSMFSNHQINFKPYSRFREIMVKNI